MLTNTRGTHASHFTNMWHLELCQLKCHFVVSWNFPPPPLAKGCVSDQKTPPTHTSFIHVFYTLIGVFFFFFGFSASGCQEEQAMYFYSSHTHLCFGTFSFRWRYIWLGRLRMNLDLRLFSLILNLEDSTQCHMLLLALKPVCDWASWSGGQGKTKDRTLSENTWEVTWCHLCHFSHYWHKRREYK